MQPNHRIHALALALLLVLPMFSMTASGSASHIETLPERLPLGRADHAMVAAPDAFYVFGGGRHDGGHRALNDIVRIDRGTYAVTTLPVTLPTARSYISAVWAENAAYIFGGCNDGSQCRQAPTREIVKFDPSTNTASVVALLPTARVASSAVWTGQFAYIFGGDSCGPHGPCKLNDIVRFDPATGSVQRMNARLPMGLLSSSAVWDGQHAYLFGGHVNGGPTNQILRYDPVADKVVALATTLPTALYWTSAAMLFNKVYVIGGYDTGRSRAIHEFDPQTGAVHPALTLVLPTGRYATASASSGQEILIAGGHDGTFQSEILRLYGPTVIRSRDSALPDLPPGAPGVTTLNGTFAPLETISFRMDMAGMAWKSGRAGASYELRFDATVVGVAPAAWKPLGDEVVGEVSWGSARAPLLASDFIVTPQGTTFALKPVIIPAHAVNLGDNAVSLRVGLDPTKPRWSVAPRLAVMELAAAPVVLVHGWTKDADWEPADMGEAYWREAARTNLKQAAVAQYGRDPWAWLGPTEAAMPAFPYDPKQHIDKSARQLGVFIREQQVSLGYTGKVSLVAHSMGGLVSRSLIEVNHGADLAHALVTIGTPHLGARAAQVHTYLVEAKSFTTYYETDDGDRLRGWGGWKDWYSLGAKRRSDRQEVIADFMLFPVDENPYLTALERSFGTTDVPYFLAAGRRYVNFPSDDVVHARSATMDYTRRACWQVYHRPHAPALDVLHNVLPEDVEIAADAMAFMTSAVPFPTCASSLSAPQMGEETNLASGQGWRANVAGALRAGESTTLVRTIEIGVGPAAEFELAVPTSDEPASARMRLVSPEGVAWTVETASGQGGLGEDLPFSDHVLQRIRIPAPTPGTWRVEAERIGDLTAEVVVVSTATVASDMRIWSASPTVVVPLGAVATLAVDLRKDAHGVSGAEVIARIQDPERPDPTTVRLFDDGLHGDGMPEDGVYAGQYHQADREVAPEGILAPGVHTVIVSAQRSFDGQVYYDEFHTALQFHAPVPCLHEAARAVQGGPSVTDVRCGEAVTTRV